MCKRRGLKVNAGKSKVMVLNGEEELECEVHVDGIHLEHVLEFKYLGCVLDALGTDGAECSSKVAGRRRVADAIKSLVSARDLQLEYTRIFHKTLLVPVLIYWSRKMLWKKKRSRLRAVQMDNLRGLLGIRRIDKFQNARIRELCEVKGLDERIDEGVIQCFSQESLCKSVCWVSGEWIKS